MGPALLSFLLSAIPALAVDISREVVLPGIEGLEVRGEIPPEIDAANAGGRLEWGLSRDALDSMLLGAGLPESSGTFEETREVPRCRVETTWSHARFRVVLSDARWLRKKGPLCRFARHLNSRWCRPDSASDLLGRGLGWGRIERTRAGSRVVSDALADRLGLICAPDDVSVEQHQLQVLTSCAEIAGPYGESCRTPFDGLPLRRSETGYEVELLAFAERVTRSPGEPRTERLGRARELTALRLGSYGALERSAEGWAGSMTVASALRAFGASVPDQELSATYSVRDASGEGLAEQAVAARLPGRDGPAFRVENFPLELRLPRAEMLELEEYSDSADAGAIAGAIGEWCQAFRGSFSPFGRFLCVERSREDVTRGLGTRTLIRARFPDQAGVERSVTWERRAPAEHCRATRSWGAIAFECDIPGPNARATWERWLADPSEELRHGGETVIFRPIEGFLPRAEGAEPLGGSVAPQARNFEIAR